MGRTSLVYALCVCWVAAVHQAQGLRRRVRSRASACSGLHFASFNIQNFGKTKASRPAVMTALAETIMRYDFVAIQELSQKPRGSGVCGPHTMSAVCDLQARVNEVAPRNYSLEVSPRIGDEQYVLLYDASRVSVIGGETYPDPANIHSRPPYAFLARAGGTTLAMAVVHTSPSTAETEIANYPNVAAWMKSTFGADEDMIVGDFNADGRYFDEDDDWQPILARMPGYMLITGNGLDTTVASSSNTYDRMLVTSSLATRCTPPEVFVIEDRINLSNVYTEGCAMGYVPSKYCDSSSFDWAKITLELSDHYPVETCMQLSA